MDSVFVATEQRFLIHDEHFYAVAGGGRDFWQRYLDVFSKITIVARAEHVASLPPAAVRVDTDNIELAAMPFYIGPFGAATKLFALSKHLRAITSKRAAFIMRVPGTIGTVMYRQLHAHRWPFGLEVVGDPYDSLSPNALGKAWMHFVRPLAVRALRQQCRDAAAVSYVTEHALQQRYPTNAGFCTHYSSTELTNELLSYCDSPRTRSSLSRNPDSETIPRLIFVGSLSQRYKGLHILLDAIRRCEDMGLTLQLAVLGDGAYREEYETLANALNISKRVTFKGYVQQGKDVLSCLCESDLFVMSSLVEGLPRAMIEAMACHLPCIGSDVGGIPELLPAEHLVPPGDSEALAAKISELLRDPEKMERAGERNRAVAMEYRSSVLREKRNTLYAYLKAETVKRIQESERRDARTARR